MHVARMAFWRVLPFYICLYVYYCCGYVGHPPPDSGDDGRENTGLDLSRLLADHEVVF